MKINPKVRVRKVVRGYKLLNKVRVNQEVYDATVVKTSAGEWTVTITDKAKAIVSQGVAKTLALGVDKLKGQLVALGARFPVKNPVVVAIEPENVPTTLTLTLTPDTVVEGNPITVDLTLLDEDGDPMSGVVVSLSLTGDGVLDDTDVLITNGAGSTVLNTTIGDAGGDVVATIGDLTETETYTITT